MSDVHSGNSGFPGTAPRTRPRGFATLRSICALVLREMSTRYGRSPGGYLWAFLEPLGAIVVLSVGFSLLLRAPSLGDSFVLFYATGFLPFMVFQNIQLMVTRALNFSKPLLAYPAVTWVDAIAARFALNLLVALMVCLCLLTGILVFTDTSAILTPGPIFAALMLAALLGLGIGTLNCLVIGLFPVWESVWSIVTRPLFLASGVLFVLEDLPRWAQDILAFNPLIHVTGVMRMGFYPVYAPGYIDPVFMALCGLGPLLLGVILLGRYHRDILNS